MAKTKNAEVVEITPISKKLAHLKVIGDTPLIMHAWSAKARREILQKELAITKTKTKAREPKNPVEDFASSMYWLTKMPDVVTSESVRIALDEGAQFGFPVTAFKQAAISAAYRLGWAKDKMSLRGAFFVEPTHAGYYSGDLYVDWDKKPKIEIIPNVYKREPMLEIHSDRPTMREDMVTVGMGSADIRYRGEFANWTADMTISYNENGPHTLEQIVNIINAGGYVCGVGEWRPERDGQYGMFHVEIVD